MASTNTNSGSASNVAAAADVESRNPGTTGTTPAAAVKDGNLNSKKYGEPLFGPNIGSVSSGPSWTVSNDKKVFTDELTTETVSGWIEKSKEPSNPTTTLQALVNLKRPTLRLSPLDTNQEDSANATNPDQDLHLHGLEFTYDCDAPKCGIHVYAHLPKDHLDAPPTSHSTLAKLQVFDVIQDGGFGNKLTIDDGAVLELGRFEFVNGVVAAVPASRVGHVQGEKQASGESPGLEATAGSESDRPATPSAPDAAVNSNRGDAATNGNHSRRRFTHFAFRRRPYNRSISGPALAVVDAERNSNSTQTGNSKTSASSKSKDEDGVKVTIHLVALDEQGTELANPNEQVTYLHIVRFGAKTEVKDKEEKSKTGDTRPWVVQVVKREATIGPHTFHLHEIYGLTSSSTGTPPPSVPPVSHAYPPDISTVVAPEEEDSQSECLLCLSSPREVVLLPCRHLVACKECALNMVEYGAGGTITTASEPGTGAEEATGGTTGAEAAAGSASATATEENTSMAPVTGLTTLSPRRKRKAKGWFCPVCRRPYTSMLRLTTTAPPVPIAKGVESGSEDEGDAPEPTNSSPPPNDALAGNSGFFRTRSGFLRTLSGIGRERERPADIENQNQNANTNQNQNQTASTGN